MRVGLLLLFIWTSAVAQVRTDGSLGPKTALVGPNFSIPASLGQQRGGNLFHSFQTFTINSGESAIFTGPATVKNILGRVTGGSPSFIAGPIQCAIPDANLYFINPAGVIFAPGASIDIKGSFVATTADSVRLGKSGKFPAGTGAGDLLTSAPPDAFGFLSKRGGVAVFGANLKVADGKNISVLSSGRVTLFSAGLLAPSGRINVVAGNGAGEVAVNPSDIGSAPRPGFADFSNVNLTNQSAINTSGTRGGPISLFAKTASLDNAQIVSGTTGARPGRAIDIQLTHTLSLTTGSSITSTNSASGRGGDLAVRAGSILINGGGNSNTALRTIALIGPGGNINVNARDITLTNSGNISVTSAAQGAAGRIDISAKSLMLESGATISGAVVAATRGADVAITTDSLRMDSGAQIGLITITAMAGGSLDLHARDIEMSGGSKIAGVATSGPAGTLSITSDSLTLRRGAQIVSGTSGAFNGGDLSIDSRIIRVDGAESSIASGPSETASGSGGTMRIRAQSIALTHRGNIAAGTLGAGNGGNLFIETNDLFIRGTGSVGSGGIFAGATETSSGNGGSVSIVADRVTVLSSGVISIETASTGRGGALEINARQLLVSGAGSVIRGASSSSGNGGAGGNIQLHVNQIEVSDQAGILAGTVGKGAGGNVSIAADSLAIDGVGSALFVGTTGAGNAGRLDLVAGDLSLTDGAQIFGGTLGSGKGGDVAITAQSIRIQRGIAGIVLSTSDPTNGGDAGMLHLKTGTLTLSDGATVLAGTFGSGNGGAMFIDAGRVTLRGQRGDTPDSSTTAIAVGTEGSGNGGRLKLRAGELQIARGAAIGVGTSASGNGGDTSIVAGKVTLDHASIIAGSDGGDVDDGFAGSVAIIARRSVSLRNHSSIEANAAVADGGSVSIDASRITLNRSAITARAGGTGGSVNLSALKLIYLFRSTVNATGTKNIGDIVIDPQFVVLDHSTLVTSTQGQGGNVSIRTERYFTSPDSAITLAPGAILNISIFNPDTDIAGQLIPVDARLGDRNLSFAEECARRLELDTSTFIIRSRGSSEVEAGGLTPSLR